MLEHRFVSDGYSSAGESGGVGPPSRVARQARAADAETGLEGPRSLTMAVYQRLRSDIITSQLIQNEKLHLATLQERFNVSLSVLREALSRLVADGLVLAEPQRGFRVSPISKKDLIDVTRTRIRIEGMALQIAIEQGDEAWLARLSASHDAMVATDRATNTPLWAERHAEFHRLLLAPCDSAWLMRFRDILFEQSERYRYMFAQLAITRKIPNDRDVSKEHRALLEAVLAHDVQAASEALHVHFQRTMQGVLAVTTLAE